MHELANSSFLFFHQPQHFFFIIRNVVFTAQILNVASNTHQTLPEHLLFLSWQWAGVFFFLLCNDTISLRLISSKPRFHYAILFATGREISRGNEG